MDLKPIGFATQNELIEILKNIWTNYLKSNENDEEDVAATFDSKQHLIELFVFYFQFIENDTWENDDFKSFFEPIPERFASFLLETVCKFADESGVQLALELAGQESALEPPSNQNENLKHLAKNLNDAKQQIPRLHNFLTRQLGQHLIEFLCQTNIKLILSQISLCNLCIILICHCSGPIMLDENKINLKPSKKTILRLMENFSICKTVTKPKGNRILEPQTEPILIDYSHQQQDLTLLQNWMTTSDEIRINFEKFKSVTKTSDQIALMLIKLLSKCVSNERENIITKQSVSVISLNFALEHLCHRTANQMASSAVKYELLHLIVTCLNNLFANENNINAIQFPHLFAKLVEIAQHNDFETNDRESILTHYALNYLIFGTCLNFITPQSQNSNVSSSSRFTDLVDENTIRICLNNLKKLLMLHDNTADTSDEVDPYVSNTRDNDNDDADNSSVDEIESEGFFSKIFKMLIKIIRELNKHQNQQQKRQSSELNAERGKFTNQRLLQQQQQQIHCQSLDDANGKRLICYFQMILFDLMPQLSIQFQESALRVLIQIGACCCHYTINNYKNLLVMANVKSSSPLSLLLEKRCFEFLHSFFLNAIFVPRWENNERTQGNCCLKCKKKSESLEFRMGILKVFTSHCNGEQQQQEQEQQSSTNSESLNVISTSFQKHLKQISHLLPHDIAAGVFKDILLRNFQHHILQTKQHTSDNNESHDTSAAGTSDPDNDRKILTSHKLLHECLNTIVTYLIHHKKMLEPFFTIQNIEQLENLLTESYLIPDISNLIKMGIRDLSDHDGNQIAIKSRLIYLQLESSETSAQHFNQLMRRLTIEIDTESKERLWLDVEMKEKDKEKIIDMMMKSIDVIKLAAVQWTLNFELLHISQAFAIKFANKYSIEIKDNQNENEETATMATEAEIVLEDELMDAATNKKTFLDLIKFNYNTLIGFLLYSTTFMSSSSMPSPPTISLPEIESKLREKKESIESPTDFNKRQLFDDLTPNNFSSRQTLITNSGDFITTNEFQISKPNPICLYSTSTNDDHLNQTADVEFEADSLGSPFLEILKDQERQQQQDEQLLEQEQKNESSEINLKEISPEVVSPPLKRIKLFDIRNHNQPIKNKSGTISTDGTALYSAYMRKIAKSKSIDEECNNDKFITRSESYESPLTRLFGLVRNSLGSLSLSSLHDAAASGVEKKSPPLSTHFRRKSKDNKTLPASPNFYNTAANEIDGNFRILLLKLFKNVLAICMKTSTNNDVEMNEHVRKIKEIIIKYVNKNWEKHSVEHKARENPVLQILQVLLKIIENSPNAMQAANEQVTTTEDIRRGNHYLRVRNRHKTARNQNQRRRSDGVEVRMRRRKGSPGSKTSPKKENFAATSSHSATLRYRRSIYDDVDSIITTTTTTLSSQTYNLNSESDNDVDYGECSYPFDDKYEADSEFSDYMISGKSVIGGEVGAADNNIPTTSFESTMLLSSLLSFSSSAAVASSGSYEDVCYSYDFLKSLIVEIVMELSKLCIQNPDGWSNNLAQIARRLFLMRDYLKTDDSLFLLQGFSTVLQCTDVRLKGLQESILELIVDLNTPELLCSYFSILNSIKPPMDILAKYFNQIIDESFKKIQASVELEFPAAISDVILKTCDPNSIQKIDSIRKNHLKNIQAVTPFTLAACIIPILNNSKIWSDDGFTISLWFQMKSTASQILKKKGVNENENLNAMRRMHLISIGTNKLMLSIYVQNMTFSFELCQPNAELNAQILHSTPSSSSSQSSSPSNHLHLMENKWTHLVCAVGIQAENLHISIIIDGGAQEHSIIFPSLRNLRNLIRKHNFQIIALGETVKSSAQPNEDSNVSNLDDILLRRWKIGFSNLMLFNRKIAVEKYLMNLTAMGPDFTQLLQCQVGNWIPNYGLLDLCKIKNNDTLGYFIESLKYLRESRILTYTANQPDIVMEYNDLINPPTTHGLIFYGKLERIPIKSIQNAIVLSGGLSLLLFHFARVVEASSNSNTQSSALNILLKIGLSNSQHYTEFVYNDYLGLISYVIKSDRCIKDVNLLSSMVNNACSQPIMRRVDGNNLHIHENTNALLLYPHIIISILHRYSDWHRLGAEHSDVLDTLLNSILALTREKHPHREFNMKQLSENGLLRELLNVCKVHVIESPNPVFISKMAAESFINILSVFAGSPPSPFLIDEIMKLLLLLQKPSECYITHDRSKFYFLLTAKLPVKEVLSPPTLFSPISPPIPKKNVPPFFEYRESAGGGESSGIAASSDNANSKRAGRINLLRKFNSNLSNEKKQQMEFLENLGLIADYSKLNKKVSSLTLSPDQVTKWRSKFHRRTSLDTPSTSKTRKIFKSSSLSPKSGITSFSPRPTISRSHMRIKSARSLQTLISGSENNLNSDKHKNVEPTTSQSSDTKNKSNIKIATKLAASNQSLKNQNRIRSLAKVDFNNFLGIIELKVGLLKLLRKFVCLLPDSTVHEVLKHYIKVEVLIVLANNKNCAFRTAIINLLSTLTKRLTAQELSKCISNFYPQHLSNQISIYPADVEMFKSCLEWVTETEIDFDNIQESTIEQCKTLPMKQKFGLNTLLALITKPFALEKDSMDVLFHTFMGFINMSCDSFTLLCEAGLLQCCVKALSNLYIETSITVSKSTVESLTKLLAKSGEISLKSVGHINIVWDILNMLTFSQQNQRSVVVSALRSIQAELLCNWINLFFKQTNVPWVFKTFKFTDSVLSLPETKKRLELLINSASQFFTIFDTCDVIPTENEVKLFKLLVSHGIATNQRCHNLIAWGLMSSRPRHISAFVIDAMWVACQDDFLPLIVCDGNMIKTLLWLCLVDNRDEPFKNLKSLCDRLGINGNDTSWNWEYELERFKTNRCNLLTKQKSVIEKTVHKFEQLANDCIESSLTLTRRVAEFQNSERRILMNYMKKYDESVVRAKWMEIISRLTHEGAPCYCKYRSENSWELDDTEGPSRVRTRLKRCHLEIDKRFIKDEYQDSKYIVDTIKYTRPLDYLIYSNDQQISIPLNSQILYNIPAKFLPVDGEIDGEIIITDNVLYFVATYRCKYFNINCDIANITEIWLKRYQHQEKAFEIFLDTNKSLFFSLQNKDDCRIMMEVFCDKIITTPDSNKMLQITQQWRDGLLTNWEYLMTLNQIGGRTYNDLMQYPVFPWILSNYTTQELDLTNVNNFRKLEKPIAVQNEESEQHFINNYSYMNSTTNIGSILLKPYHYSSHYSNSGTVLHFLIRVPPFTKFFLRYQDNNFDLPDRTFHDLSTTWRLASRDSPTDVKELIPEFFYLPEIFENLEHFKFGFRQNGERVEDVLLPPWCMKDPRMFIFIHRQALECEYVRNSIHLWIDLIFGLKQTGEHAVEAINVFHPATYATFLEFTVSDPIERRAGETMVRTYGQMPRQLFSTSHPATKPLNYNLSVGEIVKNVKGLRWGVYVGSPQLPKPTLRYIPKLPGAEYLIPLRSTNLVYGLPRLTNIIKGIEADTFDMVSWGHADRIVRIQPLNKNQKTLNNLLYISDFDDITACGSDPNCNQLWFGHKSGRISVYKYIYLDSSNCLTKGRQNYMQSLRLSYNSAFRRITSKATTNVNTIESNFNFETESITSNPNPSSNDSSKSDLKQIKWNGPIVLTRHTNEITCISLSVEFKFAVTAGIDGLAVIWDINSFTYVRTIERPAEICHSPITVIAISPTLGDIVTVHSIPNHTEDLNKELSNEDHKRRSSNIPAKNDKPATTDECFEVVEENADDFINVFINPNGKSILRLHSINARYVGHIIHEDHILAACYSYIKEGVGVNVIATAFEGGVIRLWSSWNLSYVNEIITCIPIIKSIAYSTHQHLITLASDCRIQIWESEGLFGNSPKLPQIAYK